MASSTGFDPEKGIETIKKTKGRRQLQMLGEMTITPEDSTSAGSPLRVLKPKRRANRLAFTQQFNSNLLKSNAFNAIGAPKPGRCTSAAPISAAICAAFAARARGAGARSRQVLSRTRDARRRHVPNGSSTLEARVGYSNFCMSRA